MRLTDLTEKERWMLINALRSTATEDQQRARDLINNNIKGNAGITNIAATLEQQARELNALSDRIEDADAITVAEVA